MEENKPKSPGASKPKTSDAPSGVSKAEEPKTQTGSALPKKRAHLISLGPVERLISDELDQPQPGGSGTKKPDGKISMPAGKDEDSDGSWEDQESDEDQDKLTIDEPPTKKGKVEEIVKEEEEGVGAGNIPENIIRECKKFLSLDRSLDKKAKKNNMTRKQVKLVLKHIFSSPQLLAMLRDQGLLTSPTKEEENIEAAEPKMTRSIVRTLTQAGDPCPWILNPATPMKEPAPEIVSLVTEEFPDDENDDPEYTPDLEPRISDDEDSFLMSENSEYGTPRTNLSVSTVNTPRSELGTPTDFKKPYAGTPKSSNPTWSPRTSIVSRNLHFELSETKEGYETRSRRSMTEMNIEELEQQYIPFDITPDMYDIPCDNDDYSEFLKTMYSGSNSKQSALDGCGLDEDDPEYSFPPDEEDIRLKDPEELRDDRATKISRKELADLMAELLDCATQANQEVDRSESKKKTKVKKKRPTRTLQTPVPPTFMEPQTPGPDHLPPPSVAPAASSAPAAVEPKVETEPEEINAFNDEQLTRLQLQIQQHIQQLTQMRLLSSHNMSFTEVRDQCDEMLLEILDKSTNQPTSVLNQSNLNSSLSTIHDWEKDGEDPVVIQSNRRSHKTKKRYKYVLKPTFIDFLSTRDIIYYPRLLPGCGLVRCNKRPIWTQAEDMLVAQALERLNLYGKGGKGIMSKVNFQDISITIHTKHLPAKSAQQINYRIKNTRKNLDSSELSSPITHFFKTGFAPPIVHLHEYPLPGGVPLKQLVASGRRDDIPVEFIERILQPIRQKLSKRPAPIEPKEIVVVEPDFPINSDESPDSTDSDESEAEDVKPPVRRKAQFKRRKLQPIKPKIILPKKGFKSILPKLSPSFQPQLPNSQLSNTNTRLENKHVQIVPSNCSLQFAMAEFGGNAFSPIRLMPCVDGNETPVSLSESDTPTLPPPSKLSKRSPPKTPTKPVFKSPSSFRSPLKSPFKSPLKSLTNTFNRSPLKAASDRIIRKYTSPLKRGNRDSRRLGLNSITPKRLLGSDTLLGRSPHTPPCLSSPLTSPREGELDTPTAVGRRKSRLQRETEVTLSLLGNLETPEEKEQREVAETQEMFSSIQAIISQATDLEQRYEEIINRADEAGAKETYTKLHDLLEGHPDVQVLLLDLLSPEDAVSLGSSVFSAYTDRNNLKRFLLKLSIVYRQQPAYHTKVLKELESLSKDSTLTSERLKNVAGRLFRSNQHLLDEFLMLVPGVQPPSSMLPSPEMLTLIDEDDDELEGVEVEQVPVPRSPPPAAAGPAQPSLPSVRFINGSCYVQDGKSLKPAKIERMPLTSIKENNK